MIDHAVRRTLRDGWIAQGLMDSCEECGAVADELSHLVLPCGEKDR